MATSVKANDSSAAVMAAMDYLSISPADRRQGSTSSNRAHVLMSMTPLQVYSYPSMTQPQRSRLARAILGDLVSVECAWSEQDRLPALKIMKELSRLPGSSETMATKESLGGLIQLASKENEGLDLILRILNNVLLQHALSRPDFASPNLKGLKVSLDLIATHSSPTITFLAARLVFFSTLFEAEVTKEAVEEMGLVDVFVKRTDALLQSKVSQEEDLALAELLKAFFNVGLYYPRLAKNERQEKAIVGEKFDEALLPYLAPSIRLVVSHPSRRPTSLCPPVTNAIAVLLNYPVSPYRQIWTDTGPSSSRTIKKGSNSSDDASHSGWSASTTKARRMATSFFGKAGSSSSASSSKTNQKTSSSSSSSSSSNHPPSQHQDTPSILSTLISLLDEFLQRYFTTMDPDDTTANSIAHSDDIDLQDHAEPALLLVRKLVDDVGDFRSAIKGRLLPNDIDRSQGLNVRTDLTGILVRLMSSTVFPRLARASGEVLLALCDGQATKMTAEIGYGPCAGFLMQIDQLHSLPGAPFSNAAGRAIDPVTGRVLPTPEEMEGEDEEAGRKMTEEEKEAEAERLFSLFDRLDRTGVVKVQHPVQQAVEAGRIHEVEERQDEAEKRRALDEERETETVVEREMKAFREKQKRSLKPS